MLSKRRQRKAVSPPVKAEDADLKCGTLIPGGWKGWGRRNGDRSENGCHDVSGGGVRSSSGAQQSDYLWLTVTKTSTHKDIRRWKAVCPALDQWSNTQTHLNLGHPVSLRTMGKPAARLKQMGG